VSEGAEETLAAAFRDEWPQLIGAALRIVGDLQTAEDVVQETLLVALDRWPLLGVPSVDSEEIMSLVGPPWKGHARLTVFAVATSDDAHAGDHEHADDGNKTTRLLVPRGLDRPH